MEIIEEKEETQSNKITITINDYILNEDVIGRLFNFRYISNKNIDTKIFKVLTKLGMPSNLCGYQYVREAIRMSYYNMDNYIHPNSILYPKLSKMFNIKECMVEKSIRDAITITWDRGNYDYQEELFGYTINRYKGKPTHGEFIAQIVNYIDMI